MIRIMDVLTLRCTESLLSISITDHGFELFGGVVHSPDSTVHYVGNIGVVDMDSQSRQLLRVNGEIVTGIEHHQVLNLDDDGARWEGDVLGESPFGWGIAYDSEGRKMYEGFRIGNANYYYGSSYYSDIGILEYEGEWCDGKRWENGAHYDRSGKLLFKGEWINDSHQIERRVVITANTRFCHNRVEELVVNCDCCNNENWKALDLSYFPSLRKLAIGDNCFHNVEVVKLVGLRELESVEIGCECFRKEWRGEVDQSHCDLYLKACERLKELKIGRGSFGNCEKFVAEGLPSLEVVEIGDLHENGWGFAGASLELKGSDASWR